MCCGRRPVPHRFVLIGLSLRAVCFLSQQKHLKVQQISCNVCTTDPLRNQPFHWDKQEITFHGSASLLEDTFNRPSSSLLCYEECACFFFLLSIEVCRRLLTVVSLYQMTAAGHWGGSCVSGSHLCRLRRHVCPLAHVYGVSYTCSPQQTSWWREDEKSFSFKQG